MNPRRILLLTVVCVIAAAGLWLALGERREAPRQAEPPQENLPAARTAPPAEVIGPFFIGTSWGFDGASRFYLGIGRIFN